MTWLLVMLGGAAGAASRHAFALALTPYTHKYSFPISIFLINILGSFLLGLTVAMAGRGVLPEAFRLAFGTGFLGAFTTFSTFSVELDNLLMHGNSYSAVLYASLSLFTGVLAAFSGRLLGSRL